MYTDEDILNFLIVKFYNFPGIYFEFSNSEVL